MRKAIFPIVLILFFASCSSELTIQEELQTALDKIESVKYIHFKAVEAMSNPFDSVLQKPKTKYYKLRSNPKDTVMEMEFSVAKDIEHKDILYTYDGSRTVFYNAESKKADFLPVSEELNNRPYNSVWVKTLGLLRYVTSNPDSVQINVEKRANGTFYKFTFEDQTLHFTGVIPQYYSSIGEKAVYKLWLDNDGFPKAVDQIHDHQRVLMKIAFIESSELRREDFFIAEVPEDFELKKLVTELKPDGEELSSLRAMKGRLAPNFILLDAFEAKHSLSDFGGKPLLLQFTGIGCGPCYQSLPMLKELQADYDIELLAIETWSTDAAKVKQFIGKMTLTIRTYSTQEELILPTTFLLLQLSF